MTALSDLFDPCVFYRLVGLMTENPEIPASSLLGGSWDGDDGISRLWFATPTGPGAVEEAMASQGFLDLGDGTLINESARPCDGDAEASRQRPMGEQVRVLLDHRYQDEPFDFTDMTWRVVDHWNRCRALIEFFEVTYLGQIEGAAFGREAGVGASVQLRVIPDPGRDRGDIFEALRWGKVREGERQRCEDGSETMTWSAWDVPVRVVVQ